MRFSSGGEETPCGRGSTMAHTEEVREFLPKLISAYGIRSMVDVGCGDANWIRGIELGDCTYHGIDVDSRNLEDAKRKAPHMKFSTEADGEYDLALIRHVLQHLKNSEALSLLNEWLGKAKWVLATSHPGTTKNLEITRSRFRPINLGLPLFGMKPEKVFKDDELELWLIKGRSK